MSESEITSRSFGFGDSSSSELDIQRICGYQSDSRLLDSDSDSGDTIVLSTDDSASDATVTDQEETTEIENVSTLTEPCCTKQANDDDEERKSVISILMNKCCSNDCLLHLTGYAILTTRRKVCCLKGSERRQWIIDKLLETSCYINGKLDIKFNIGGMAVCKSAFLLIYSFPPRTISRAIKSIRDGGLIVEHGNKGRKKATRKCEEAKTWMSRYFKLIGDKMPTNGQIHLPSWDTQKDVYSRFKDDMIEQKLEDDDIISLSLFYKIWREDFTHVVIPENSRFSKCDICVRLKLERQGSFDKEKKKALVEAKDSHLKLVEIERKKYHSHREKARNDPEKYMAIIIDGMDQSKTNLPNTSHISKSLSSLWRIRTHITGTLIHTKAPHGKLAYAFIDLLQWPHGSNLTLTILLKSISDYQKSHPLSKTLYVQMDNTCRENKNCYVLCTCAVLVQMRIFEKVQLNFLPVGHTHEDIDQLFSKISEEIRKSGCESLSDLIGLIHRCSTPNPTTVLLDGVWDFKQWLEPYMAVMEQHSWYHCYRFTRNSTGIAEMHYKQYSGQPWLPDEDGIQLPGDQILIVCVYIKGDVKYNLLY